ncbi:KpsF/GutQ family sugar-phosphate isomerase [Agaribacterium haliotis]|uniref:KpsF/GutQ family sugar-phosphate isomerase n=1 Tax=Agaribacterium haliotis TaxID=2013869 RepID=UPI000BB55803|nr:KpsF/GutQ family sugar-phosphate isomerase [Agaribacterium haliotis]
MTNESLIESGRTAVEIESQAVAALLPRIDQKFASACKLLLDCRGRVIVTGMGKSGHIANKIAATLASTGTPAFFVHPGEASHGDFGMITRDDVIIAISNSGSTNELVTLIPMFKRLGVAFISMSGKPASPLAEFADVNLDVSVAEEACPHNLAPTSSTTVTLVMGDALAVALLKARGFSAEDFAFSHPGGALGRKLLLRCRDLMHSGADLPSVDASSLLSTALSEMTGKGFGMTMVLDGSDKLLGIFTDGDLRRAIARSDIDLNTAEISEVMTSKPLTVGQDLLAAEALHIMENHKITALVVADDAGKPVGLVHMHDLLRAGIY